MISRSVPGYGLTLQMIGVLTSIYAPHTARCFDLGCSLGAATLQMRHHLKGSQSHIVAVDSSAAMIDKLRKLLEADSGKIPVTLLQQDIRDVAITGADVVVLNFTLQFIPPAERKQLLQKIFDGMKPGAVLLLSEKIRFDDIRVDAQQSEMHEAFKRNQGYTDLEIAQKRTALDNVLVRDSLAGHEQRLHSVGFKEVLVWFQCFNFFSLLAIRGRD